MVPVLTRAGRSFKGAAAYYLHDKRQEGEAERLTGDRVAWTATVNLPTDDADRAWRMMAHTAMSQTELKKAAGVPLTGQKLKGPVLAYSLSWHPDERPTQAEQMEAARESLKALGLEDRQAIIIAHNDTAHAHVHIIANRVSHETGIAAEMKGSKNRIQKWARIYQQQRGQTYCPQREENARKRRQGQHANSPRVARNVYEFVKRVANDSLKAGFTLSEQRQKDAQLYGQSREQAKSHGRQWKELQRTHEGLRGKLGDYETRRAGQAEATIKDGTRPQWDALLKRQHEEVRRVEAYRAAARRNAERIAADPSIALKAMTAQHSTFTRRDLTRFIGLNSDDAKQTAAVAAKVEASPEIVRLGTGKRGEERFTTREMQTVERRMMEAADKLAASQGHQVSEAAKEKALHGRQLGDEQAAAFRHVTGDKDLALVVGFAGTGKSTMLGAARQAWESQGYTVRGATLSGIAADSLEAGSGIESRTVAKLEYEWGQGNDRLTSRDVLVIDEAGMIDSRRMGRLLSAAQQAGAKVVLVGDPAQLQAIEAGAAFRAIGDRHGKASITEVRRQLEGWQRRATKDLATGRTGQALSRYGRAGMVQAHASRDDAKTALVRQWAEARRVSPDKSRIILAYTRDDVAGLNEQARAKLREAGELGRDEHVRTERGARNFASGDRMMFLKNDRNMGVKNGTLATVERVGNGSMTVKLDGEKASRVSFNIQDYSNIDHGYASTVHKSQGVTVDRAHVLASPHMDRHAAYVALTRHRDGVALHYGQDDFGDDRKLARALGRERAKDTTLDYQAGLVEQAAREREAGGGLVGFLCALFNPGDRRAELDTRHKQEREGLTKRIGAAIRSRVDGIRQQTGTDTAKLRREYESRGAKLATTQAAERAGTKAQWRGRNAERRAAFNVAQTATQAQQQGRQQGISRSIRDDDRYRQQPGKPGPI